MKKNKSAKFNGGFTLIEIIVGTGVLLVVGAVLTGILVASFRARSKTDIITHIRQNGNSAITRMSRSVRNAARFDGVSLDNLSYISDCTNISPTPIHYKYLRISSFDGGQTTYSCSQETISSNGASLVDSATAKTDSCYFICRQQSLSDSRVVEISFSLSQKSTGALFENTSTIPFQTSVELRNSNR